MTPPTPGVGTPVRFALRVPEGAPPPAEVRVWVLDRTRPPGDPERRGLQAAGPGLVATQVLPLRPLPLRLGIAVGDDTAWFTIPVGPEAPPEAPPAPPAAGVIPMDVQHRAMARLGDAWAVLGGALDRPAPDLAAARAALPATRGWAALTPHFVLHRHEDALPEFRGLADDLLARLAALDAAVGTGDAAAARTRWRETDAWACLRCHMKFRWGIARDLSRFPDLTDPERTR